MSSESPTQPDHSDEAEQDAFDDQRQQGSYAEMESSAEIEDVLHELRDRLAAAEAERADFKERWMRAEAEMINLRNRTKREVDDARQYAVQKFARDVAEAADNMRRGLDSLPKAESGETDLIVKLREGFEGVERSFLALLERNGVAKTDPVFKPFDANLHQAMAEQPSAEHPPGTVLQAWTPVWTLNGRLLRAAMVVVSKADK